MYSKRLSFPPYPFSSEVELLVNIKQLGTARQTKSPGAILTLFGENTAIFLLVDLR